MKLYEDLKYVGNGTRLDCFKDGLWHCTNMVSNKGGFWHCTNMVSRLSTGQLEYVIQQPYYHEGIFMGYTNLEAYVITEDELVENFKIVKEDGSLEDIIHSRDNKALMDEFKKIDEFFENMTDEELKKAFKL